MCGIVGYISTDDKLAKDEKYHFMHYALMLDTLRGRDSTGIIRTHGRFNVNAFHTCDPGDRWVHTDEYREQAKQAAWARIGHNRAATKGSVKLANAHPFTFGDVTLVHNGTLWGGGRSLDTFDDKLEVDSMQIALALSKAAPEDAHKVLEQIDGSFCLVWTDRRNESINMCRNDERPMHFTWNKGKEILWYMSDGIHLHTVNKSMGRSSFRGDTIYKLDRLKMLTYTKGSIEPEIKSFKKFERPAYSGKARESKLDEATRRWEARKARELGRSKTESSAGSKPTGPRVQINGQRRRIPQAQIRSLKSIFDLKPNDMLEFQPHNGLDLGTHRYMVTGDLIHEGWGDAPIDAVVLPMPEVRFKAYRGQPWLVCPVGLGPPISARTQKSPGIASVICHVVSTDYKAWLEASTEPEEEEQDRDDRSNILVIGPGNAMVESKALDTALREGCVSCACNLNWEDRKNYMWVNDDRDLLCETCIADMSGRLIM